MRVSLGWFALVRVVGFEDDGAKIVERAQSALDEAAFPQLDFMVFGCSEYRGHIAECFKLDDFSTRVDHKLLLLVTRVDGPAVGSIIPVFYKCAKNSGWDMGGDYASFRKSPGQRFAQMDRLA